MADSGADRDVIGEQTIKRLNIGTTNADLRVVTVDNEIVSQRKLASFPSNLSTGNIVPK